MDLTESKKRGYEVADAKIKPLVWSGLGLSVLAVLSLIAMWGLFELLAAYESSVEPKPSPVATREVPPKPLLQVDPYADWNTQREHENSFLNNYRFIDRDTNVVALPIERAKEIMAQRGLPSRSAPAVDVSERVGDAATDEEAVEAADTHDEIGVAPVQGKATRAAAKSKKKDGAAQ